ncbi:MAG: glycerophosphodiester phosphodiesterase [Promethearchaeota archaeon]
MLVFAHRGASNIAPENTLKAFEKAIELQADFIEFDIHKSKDNIIVVMHDANTFRTTGRLGVIKNMTLGELKQLDCGDGEKIPTLEEVIRITKNKIKLNIEVKARGLVEELVEKIENEGILESVIISSFKLDVLLRVKKLNPQIKLASLEPTRIGWLNSWISRKKLLKDAIENNFFAINPFHVLVTQKFINKAHKNNLKVFPWTVNSDAAIRKLIKMGIDGIITNKIYRVKEVLNQQ